jgi:ribosomal protein L34
MERMTKVKKVKRARKHGFLVLMSSHAGRKVIKRRRAVGRAKLTV